MTNKGTQTKTPGIYVKLPKSKGLNDKRCEECLFKECSGCTLSHQIYKQPESPGAFWEILAKCITKNG